MESCLAPAIGSRSRSVRADLERIMVTPVQENPLTTSVLRPVTLFLSNSNSLGVDHLHSESVRVDVYIHTWFSALFENILQRLEFWDYTHTVKQISISGQAP